MNLINTAVLHEAAGSGAKSFCERHLGRFLPGWAVNLTIAAVVLPAVTHVISNLPQILKTMVVKPIQAVRVWYKGRKQAKIEKSRLDVLEGDLSKANTLIGELETQVSGLKTQIAGLEKPTIVKFSGALRV